MASPEVGDGWTEANHEGYTGQGFFNFDNSAYSTATYNVTSDQSASNARVMIRYSFQGNADRDMKVTVDNGVYDVTFKSTGSWDKWDTVYVDSVWVDALDFKVKLASASADGGPNIDMIAFDIKGVYRTGCKPAKVKNDVESASSSTDAIVKRPTDAPAGRDSRRYNALGRMVPGEKTHSKLPKGRYFSR
jgi:hypothetical protein